MYSKLSLEDIFTSKEKIFYSNLSPEDKINFENIILNRFNLAGKDLLTGLYNRNVMDFRLNNVLAGFKRNDFKCKKVDNFSLIFFDIDYFKKINDTFGHKIGDDILKTYSSILIENKQRENDNIFRYGGEEFMIILQDSNLNYAIEYTKIIKKELETRIVIIKNDNNKYLGIDNKYSQLDSSVLVQNVNSSFGVINYKESFNISNKYTVEGLLEKVDSALYNSKNNGRNVISYIKNNELQYL